MTKGSVAMRSDELAAAVADLVESLDMSCYDVDWIGTGSARTFRVLVEREGGIDLDAVASVSRSISALLDEHDVTGPYQLEVSSPGIERPLRTSAHFAAVLGSRISVKFRNAEGMRRETGTLSAINSPATATATATAEDAESIELQTDTEMITILRSTITAAHVAFEWSASPRQKGSR